MSSKHITRTGRNSSLPVARGGTGFKLTWKLGWKPVATFMVCAEGETTLIRNAYGYVNSFYSVSCIDIISEARILSRTDRNTYGKQLILYSDAIVAVLEL